MFLLLYSILFAGLKKNKDFYAKNKVEISANFLLSGNMNGWRCVSNFQNKCERFPRLLIITNLATLLIEDIQGKIFLWDSWKEKNDE